jgi:ferrous iron transport protein B
MRDRMKKFLLMGNPNVGKSVIFSRLTGAFVVASNYPGTTVEFTKGSMLFKGEKTELLDVPGTYTLRPTTKAEEVACEMLEEGNLVINVVDATNLERNLNLTLELIERGVPMVVVLNMWDETKHRGVTIDVEKLEGHLGVPVVCTCGVTGEGIKKLVSRLEEAKPTVARKRTPEGKWAEIGRIVRETQSLVHRHHTSAEILGDASVRPMFGLLMAGVIIYLAFKVVRFIGEWLVGLTESLFDSLWAPLMMKVSSLLGSGGFLHNILIGKLFEGQIDFGQSFGLLTTGLFVPFAMVLPYIFSFYLILGILEDSGYLPRLAVLVDNVTHRVGLHGFSSVSMILGLGCNIPGALATRVLETKRERFIASTLMAICVPCMAQIAMIVALVGSRGGGYLAAVFGSLFIVWGALGVVLNRILKGESMELFMEIPPYRFLYWGALVKKLGMRIRQFITTAIPLVLLGVLIVNIFYTLRVIEFVGRITAPIVTGLLGLPKEAVSALIIGFLRKDVAVGMLAPLGLTSGQLVVACVVLTMYFPCVGTFAILLRELGIKDMLKSAGIMIVSALLFGGLLNLIFR